jgi:hypothetical protein
MVTRYQPKGGMDETASGDFVEFAAYEQLKAEYVSLFDFTSTLLAQVEGSDLTPAKAAEALAVLRRLVGV